MLVEDATELTHEIEIDRLLVHTHGSIDEDVTGWPLETPELSGNSCLIVGEPVEVEAMLAWLDGAGLDELDRRLTVVAAAPGVPNCEG